MSFFKQLDSFAIPIQFSFQGKIQAGSYSGSFISFIMLALSILLAINVSSELWERNQPNLQMSSFFEQRKIYLKDFPIVFAVVNLYNQPYENIENYLTFSANIFSLDSELTPSIIKRNLVKCVDKLQDYSPVAMNSLLGFTQEQTQLSLCFDFKDDDYIVGNQNAPMNKFIQVKGYLCQGSSNCKSKDEIRTYLQGFNTVAFFPMITNVNGYNYEHPIQSNPQSVVMLGSFDIKKTIYVDIQNYQFQTDDGLLTTNWKYDQGQLMGNKFIDFQFVQSDNQLFTFSITSSSQTQLIKRVYLKLSESLAKIMGFVTSAYAIIYYLMRGFQKFLFHILFVQKMKNEGIKVSKVNNKLCITREDTQQTKINIEKYQKIQKQNQISEIMAINLFAYKFFTELFKIKDQNQYFQKIIEEERYIKEFLSFEGLLKLFCLNYGQNQMEQLSSIELQIGELLDSRFIYQSGKPHLFKKRNEIFQTEKQIEIDKSQI